MRAALHAWACRVWTKPFASAGRSRSTVSSRHRAIGFLTGQQADWLPPVMQILRADLPAIDLRVLSRHSVEMADELQRRELDLGFMRVEPRPGDAYRVIAQERLVVMLPRDHRLTPPRRHRPARRRGRGVHRLHRHPARPARRGGRVSAAPRCRGRAEPPHRQCRDGPRAHRLRPRGRAASGLCRAAAAPLGRQPAAAGAGAHDRPRDRLADNGSPMLRTLLAGIDRLAAIGPAGDRPRP
jgi:LysR family transcriptional regulator, hca operon transcriptional activator